jgi:hypothetical protein
VRTLIGEPYETESLGMQRTCIIGFTLVHPDGDRIDGVLVHAAYPWRHENIRQRQCKTVP